MRINFHVYHEPSSRDPWQLTEAQVAHEYSTFQSMLNLYFCSPNVQAERICGEPSNKRVFVSLVGEKSETELTQALNSFLVMLNVMRIKGRSYQPNFVASKTGRIL